jgi:hypothetical protein
VDRCRASRYGESSWREYVDPKYPEQICTKKNVILEQFKTSKDYKNFALSSLKDIKTNKKRYAELEE